MSACSLISCAARSTLSLRKIGHDRCVAIAPALCCIELASHDRAEQIGIGDDSPEAALLVVTDDADRVNPMPCHEPRDVAQR